ncbi:SDR family oxidoreductase [candidate division KSB3 bacterium]|uniref:SDR family oxidoreductase n=1 Tax=candidate division KSB3 bacterium TaxID=2044937 RepID=A0A9D5Q8Q6_9BACT|nr:SDR family oxidoreductase [candidate division KSB3 bacterium]MBD3327091.1 SDR family oxidoreductase [candidate division KSB3 bacterium]
MIQNPFDFSQKVAVVTGGSGVLCGAISESLAACGAHVVVVGHHRMEKAHQRVNAISEAGGSAIAVEADVLSKSSIATLLETTLDQFGQVDFLINGAGGAKKEATTSEELSFFDLPEEAIRKTFDLNFMGTFLVCQVFGRAMVEQGHGNILNVSSMGAFRPLTRSVAYSAGKAAVTNFTQWLAVHMSQEYSPAIRVNAVVPGFFLTEQNRFLLLNQTTGDFTERGSRIIAHTPMARLGKPKDLLGPVLWLLSDAAEFVHGSTVIVDGGLSAYGGV